VATHSPLTRLLTGSSEMSHESDVDDWSASYAAVYEQRLSVDLNDPGVLPIGILADSDFLALPALSFSAVRQGPNSQVEIDRRGVTVAKPDSGPA